MNLQSNKELVTHFVLIVGRGGSEVILDDDALAVIVAFCAASVLSSLRAATIIWLKATS